MQSSLLDSRAHLRSAECSPAISPQTPQHYKFLDSLRGIAIIGIVLIHATAATPNLPSQIHNLLWCGHFGVQLFFVISGCTLTLSWVNRTRNDTRPLPAFLIRRTMRIVPLFWAGTILYILKPIAIRSLYAPLGVHWNDIALTALLLHGFSPTMINAVVPGGWSVADEVMFYFLFPLLIVLSTRLKRFTLLTLSSIALIGLGSPIAYKWLTRLTPDISLPGRDAFAYFNFANQLPVFLIGIFVGQILAGKRELLKGNRSLWHIHSLSSRTQAYLLVTVSLLLIFRLVPEHVLAAIASGYLIYALDLYPTRLLVNPVTEFLGKVSYSIYIWHFAMLERIAPSVLNWWNFPHNPVRINALFSVVTLIIVVLLVTCPLAAMSYWAIERPGIAIGRRLVQRLGWGPTNRRYTVAV